MTPTPHDAFFKATFSAPARAAELLRPLLDPALAARIDWDSLELRSGSHVDESLRAVHADLMFAARMQGREIRLYLLLEHKSGADRWTALQLLRYMTNAWLAHLDEHKDAFVLPPILPVVIHHGDQAWSIATEFSALVDLDGLDALRAFTPQFQYTLADLATVDGDELRAREGSAEVRLALLALKETRAAADVGRFIASLAVLLNELEWDPDGPRAIQRFFSYLFSVRGPQDLATLDVRRLGLGKTSEAIMETYEGYLLRTGREQGREEMFLDLLRARFGEVPADALTRLHGADVDDLTRWGLRIVTAATIDDVFAD